jgi:hypothetical protein
MAVASETLGMMSDHRSEGGGKNAVLPPDTIAPEGGGENTGMFAPLVQAAIPTDDTSEGGGEIVDRIHDSSHLMGQWTTDVEQRPQPLTMQNGLAWLTRECDSLAAADMWSAVEEITRGVIAGIGLRHSDQYDSFHSEVVNAWQETTVGWDTLLFT